MLSGIIALRSITWHDDVIRRKNDGFQDSARPVFFSRFFFASRTMDREKEAARNLPKNFQN